MPTLSPPPPLPPPPLVTDKALARATFWAMFLLTFLPIPSLLLPVLCLRRCRHIHLPMSTYLMHLLYCISSALIVRSPSLPLNLSAMPRLSHISSASVFILPHLLYGPHHIVFHSSAYFNAIICLCVSCISLYLTYLYLSLYLPLD